MGWTCIPSRTQHWTNAPSVPHRKRGKQVTLEQPQFVKDMLNLARITYIDWLMQPTKAASENLANELSKIADELDITESAALEMVKGNETTN